jgi:DeoR family transcriptional regulator, suf operon transcriptional repressor
MADCQKSESAYSMGMNDQGSSPPQPRAADTAVLDLLRVEESLGVGELATALGVTATAVRQRLDRLMRLGLVERSAIGGRRGRPSHAYRLTAAGRRVGGDNFHDLALVLWREIRGIRDAQVRRGLLGRIGSALAAMHKHDVQGASVAERLRGVAGILGRRNIACTVETDGRDGAALPVLTSYACPYPDLAEEDRGICAAERRMIEELVGESVRLSECRLDGGSCCRFTAGVAADAGADERVEDLQTQP